MRKLNFFQNQLLFFQKIFFKPLMFYFIQMFFKYLELWKFSKILNFKYCYLFCWIFIYGFKINVFQLKENLNACFLFFFAFLKLLGDAKLNFFHFEEKIQKYILCFLKKHKKNILYFFGKIQKNILRNILEKFRRCGLKTFL